MDKYNRDIAEGNLYKDELFIIPEQKTVELSGTYSFPLLFVLNHQDEQDVSTEDLIFLNSILKQIPNDSQLDINQIGVINLNQSHISILSIIQKFNPSYIITWGNMDHLKGIEKSLLCPLFLGDIGLINCPEIEEIKENKEQKILLWQSMKTVFNIT